MTTATPPAFAAVDLGASGGRVMRGVVDTDAVRLEEVHRFANGVVDRDGHLRWDIGRLYDEVLTGLARVGDVVSIGIATWGVDYGLLDGDGRLMADPIAYRDDRTAKVIDAVHAAIAPDELYSITGVQFLPFNTVYQLAADQRQPYWPDVASVVLLPDLVSYWLTGALACEPTNASTTALVDARSRTWSEVVLNRLDISAGRLCPLQPTGSQRGVTANGTPVVSVGSHDTASAVVAVPASTDRFAYIVSGTWSLVGLELPAPVLTAAARAANFTNEIGVDGRTRFLRNVGGLWLLQECMRAWGTSDLAALLGAAREVAPGGPRVDVDDPAFIPPGDMPERIARAAGASDMSRAEVVRCILDSLAHGYATTVRQAAALADRDVDVVHVVGGGSQNELLCQLTANACGLPVVGGPVEATALGNVLVQGRAAGVLPPSLDDLRRTTARSAALRHYEPR